MAACNRKDWRPGLRLSKGVHALLERRPSFLLVIQEVCRRHARDWPAHFESGLHRTVFERADLPGGGLVLRSACTRGRVVSALSFIGGSL